MTATSLERPTTQYELPEPGTGVLLADLRPLGYGRVELWMVDPSTATEWLGHNTHNRNLKWRKIEQMKADLSMGEWSWTGEPVRRGPEGVVLDGQNRLHAVIESGATIAMLVIWDLPAEAQRDMDTGAPRKLNDVLTLEGEANASSLGALIKLVYGWEQGQRRSLHAPVVSNAQCMRTLDRHPELRELIVSSRVVGDRCGVPASLVGLAWWVTARLDTEDAEHFFKRLGDGQGLVKGDPIYELRRTLDDEKKNVRGDRSRVWMLAIMIKAWNAYRRGENVALYRWRPGGAKPEPFPEPI